MIHTYTETQHSKSATLLKPHSCTVEKNVYSLYFCARVPHICLLLVAAQCFLLAFSLHSALVYVFPSDPYAWRNCGFFQIPKCLSANAELQPDSLFAFLKWSKSFMCIVLASPTSSHSTFPILIPITRQFDWAAAWDLAICSVWLTHSSIVWSLTKGTLVLTVKYIIAFSAESYFVDFNPFLNCSFSIRCHFCIFLKSQSFPADNRKHGR